MNKKLIGVGIGIAIAIVIVILIEVPSYKTHVENTNQSNTQLTNATQKPLVTGKHFTVELNESMSLSTR